MNRPVHVPAAPRFVVARWDGRVWRLQSWHHYTMATAVEEAVYFEQNRPGARFVAAEVVGLAEVLEGVPPGKERRVKTLAAAKAAARAIPRPT